MFKNRISASTKERRETETATIRHDLGERGERVYVLKVEELESFQHGQEQFWPPYVCAREQRQDLEIIHWNDQKRKVEVFLVQNVRTKYGKTDAEEKHDKHHLHVCWTFFAFAG